MPNRNRVLVPSKTCPPSRPLILTPFSCWKLPVGTTRLELVTSGRSGGCRLPPRLRAGALRKRSARRQGGTAQKRCQGCCQGKKSHERGDLVRSRGPTP